MSEVLTFHDEERPSWSADGPRPIRAHALAAIDRPVAIRSAGADDIAPPENNADVYAQAIPGAEVGHYAFIGSNPEGSDVRERVPNEAVDFFVANLRPAS